MSTRDDRDTSSLARSMQDRDADRRVGVFLLDGNLKVRAANGTAARLVRQPLTKVLGADHPNLIASCLVEDLANGNQFWAQLKKQYEGGDGALRCTCQVRGGAGRPERWIAHWSEPIRSGPYEGGRIEWYEDLSGMNDEAARQAVYHLGDQMMLTNRDGRIRHVNRAFEEMTGYDEEELLGQTPRILKSGYHEEDFFEELWSTIRAGRTFRARIRNERKDGTVYVEEETIVPIRAEEGKISHFVATGRDVTIEEEQAQALARSEQFYRALFKQAVNPVAITDENGRFYQVNDAFCEAFGYDRDTLMEMSAADLYVEEGRREDFLAQIRSEGRVDQFEVQMAGYEGRPRHYRLSSQLLDVNGSEPRYQTLLVDITEQKERERDLAEAKTAAQEASELKSALLHNMSHEFRTPLTTILGYADLLLKEAPESLRELIEPIQAGGQRLQTTLENVLDLAQLETEGRELRPERIELWAFLGDLVETFRPEAQRKGLHMQLNAPDPPVRAITDRDLLEQILSNLLHNGIKFTEEGTVTLSLETRAEEELIFQVRDTGIGISEDRREQLFAPFMQESKGLSRTHEGTGLGLTVVKSLAELAGGSVNLDSQKGRGTTVEVRLPRELAEDPESADSPEESAISVTQPAPRRTLAVDDDPAMLDLIGEMLPDGWDLDRAQGADEALRQLQENSYGLVLLDINLKKERNGMDVLQEFRQMEGTEDVPVVALTAYTLPGDRDKFMNAGFDAHISKPFTRDELHAQLPTAEEPTS